MSTANVASFSAGYYVDPKLDRINGYILPGSPDHAPKRAARYGKRLADYRKLWTSREQMCGLYLRTALEDAAPYPDDLHSPGDDVCPIDMAAYTAITTIQEWKEIDDKLIIQGAGLSPEERCASINLMEIALEHLRWHELLLDIKRIGRLRSLWMLRPCNEGFLLDLVPRNEHDTPYEGLVIKGGLPREHVRDLIRAYEDGMKRGHTIMGEQVSAAMNRCRHLKA